MKKFEYLYIQHGELHTFDQVLNGYGEDGYQCIWMNVKMGDDSSLVYVEAMLMRPAT